MKWIDRQFGMKLKTEVYNFGEYLMAQVDFLGEIMDWMLGWAGEIKGVIAKLMYRQRGRFSPVFMNTSMALIMFVAIVMSTTIESTIGQGSGEDYDRGAVMATDAEMGVETKISSSNKGEITEYRVQEGDTVSEIADKFKVSIDTIMWENELKSVEQIKAGQILRILPDIGIRHKVKRGETVYSIARNYSVDAQNIVDYPFNTFTNDETYSLAAGQEIFIPDGIKPKEIIRDTTRYVARTVAPVPGVRGEGGFIWPTSGKVSQRYYWYHQAVDIADSRNPDIVASQGGTVVTAGWNAGGYGNYVIIDHGNGYKTLYAHMLNGSISVKAGGVVRQGQKLGVMGSTGRSTGTHLHFEVISMEKGKKLDPLSVIK